MTTTTEERFKKRFQEGIYNHGREVTMPVSKLLRFIEDEKSIVREEARYKQYQFVNEAIDLLRNIDSRIGVAVRVEIDDSRAIKTIIGEMEWAVANKLLGEARKKLLDLLSQEDTKKQDNNN